MEKLGSFEWRICNLYMIKDPTGKAVPFKPNWAQWDFLENIWYFNVILKARQLGFSTLIDLYLLDSCLFNENHSCGIVADTMDNAKKLFEEKIKFAYDNLPEFLRTAVTIETDNALEMKFSNGSSITVGVSLRSGTYQKLHVSEYGKVSIKAPEKAKEIKTGAFNTVHRGQQMFVESTAEGQGGEFFNLVQLARKLEDQGKELTPLDPKFHFYPWHENPEYTLPDGEALRVIVSEEMRKYFTELEKESLVMLTYQQKAWYATKEALMGEDMWREFPSTPEESFAASVDGAIYARQMRMLRKNKQIVRVPWEPRSLVHTFWDLGSFNYMAIWFFQQIGREWRMIRFYQDTGQDLGQYVNYMRELGYSYGDHYLPHDGNTKKLQATGGNKTTKEMLIGLGLGGNHNIKIVPVTKDKRRDIETVCKPAILKCWFDEVLCSDGIKCLDNYKRQKNKDGVWIPEPLHDEYSDGADSFRTFAMGWKDKVLAAPKSMNMPAGKAPL